MDFELVEVGLEGRVEVIPKPQVTDPGGVSLPLSTLPIGLPPVLPTLEEELEELLSNPQTIPVHDIERAQRFIPRQSNPEALYSLDVSTVQTTIVVDRNPTTGQLLGFKEEFISDSGSSAKNSTSLKRPPGPLSENVRGSSTNAPFWPGGLEEPNLDALKSASTEVNIDFENDLLTTPPGFSHGVTFDRKSLSSDLDLGDKPSVLNLTDILSHSDYFDFEVEEEVEGNRSQSVTEQPAEEEEPGLEDTQKQVIYDIIKLEDRIEIPGERTLSDKPKEEWAVKVDINTPVDDFHKQVPDMAYTWPFELDVFQKQAILHLEKHNNVFVAAHTSAGKTVIAEYAIALSLKHMTRTIYTSPIKALSNQKFRDFKTTFKDVGLITGDVQINPQAACLIMTTEILRSMLYNGSDVVRDLEWVIFDEVHYINDAERGVVWEEVLIMLPDHVHIILLSATVPNTLEFADWVGRTKKRQVYVVSTQKRPVPLEHFLYTGNSSKTSSELFMILDASKNFLQPGYNKALDAKKERPNKPSQGAKGHRSGGNPQQDKNVWLSVIDMLKKKKKLPVVAFTFSKKRIDENANHMSSVDLLVATEKSEVHIFFHRCISKLKGTDRNLPQVKHLEDLLKRGIGVHHSGVLPILKEVVEMLFQRGLVKILFATETFAMGVNMPARTVVFDSIRKHDGKAFRDLLPGEYIQMAGRAGRRGLDTTGTVIILCKGDIPEMADLHKMMMGRPTLLQSQFRLTYTMILNLLRVEQLRVEDMMKRSFSEFHNQKESGKHKHTLEDLVRRIGEMPEVADYSGDLEQYYRTCEEYHTLRDRLQKVMMSHPQAIKALTPGRVVIIDTPLHKYSLGIVLQTGPLSSKERTLCVLILCEQQSNEDYGNLYKKNETKDSDNPEESPEDISPAPFVPDELFRPEGSCGQKMVKIPASDVSVITLKTVKIIPERIMDDIRKREQTRFRSDPPGQSTSVATQELLRLTEAHPRGLPGLDPLKDLHIRDMDLVEEFRRLDFLVQSFSNYHCVHAPNFEENFKQLRSNMKLRDRYNNVKYLLSDQSLQLLPEYQQRIQVLRDLQYIDSLNTVQLKGRVACEISSHELIITELVFENILTELHPTEIAAVLSCVVFEQRRCSEPELAPTLVKVKEDFQAVAQKIGILQRECGLSMPAEDYVDQFHFGLMEVVYEWARGMPFAEITELTDVQEGIIVRCIQRLDETLKDVRNAARIIGDPVLYQKMEESSGLIKRDIVFAASLYTQ